jgi:hypothetical protein
MVELRAQSKSRLAVGDALEHSAQGDVARLEMWGQARNNTLNLNDDSIYALVRFENSWKRDELLYVPSITVHTSSRHQVLDDTKICRFVIIIRPCMKCKAMNSTKNNARYSVLILLLLSSPQSSKTESQRKRKEIICL